MFGYFFGDKQRKKKFDVLIDAVLQKMDVTDEDSEEYSKLMNHLDRLTEIKKKERNDQVGRDTVAIIAGNLAGILLIIIYEQKHVMTSKGFNQLIRPK